jgi:hypothetical protein
LNKQISIILASISIFAMISAPLSATSTIQFAMAEKPDNVGRPDDLGKPQIVPINEEITKQLFVQDDGTILERTTHIFYLEGANYKENHAKGGSKGGGSGGGNTDGIEQCFSFLENGMRWKSTESYLVNPSNSGLENAFGLNTIEGGAESWDDKVAFEIFGSSSIDSTAQVILTSIDDKNVVIFGTVTDENDNVLDNVIAVTYTWANWGAPKPWKQILEWDMVFNTGSFDFGDASGSTSLMDLSGIGTHELGHAAGMGHTQTNSLCQDQTMYPTAGFGETKKRTLELGDITGIKKLYS